MQGRWWICTVSCEREPAFIPSAEYFAGLRDCTELRGQREVGTGKPSTMVDLTYLGGFEHWQFVVGYSSPKRLVHLRSTIAASGHYELTRSAAARAYVVKDDTAVAGTKFLYGGAPMRRNEPTDWESVWTNATTGDLSGIPADVRVRCFNQLLRIGSTHCRPAAMDRSTRVYWGISGSGKVTRHTIVTPFQTHLAYQEASAGGLLPYFKDPCTKWWDGYQGNECVVVDEFRGQIGVSHLLRWLDKYPCRVETKGGSLPLCATRFWITSNIPVEEWYPELDAESLRALKRRMEVVHFGQIYGQL